VTRRIAAQLPASGTSLLGGNLQGRMIQCRVHGLRFDLASGCMAKVTNSGFASYPLEIRSETIQARKTLFSPVQQSTLHFESPEQSLQINRISVLFQL